MIHIHARTPDGVPSYEIDDFRAITEAIRAEAGDVIINYSTGAIGVPLEKRIAYLRELKPDIGALNMGSMNYAKYSRRRKDFVFKTVFENSFDTIIELCTAMREAGIRPEHECFDSGHIANLDPLLDMGLLGPPLQISCVMGVTRRDPAVARATSPTWPSRCPRASPHEWGVIGISRQQWSLVAAALTLGGNVRVGLEDNFYLPDGEMARSNGDLVARARAHVPRTSAGGRRRSPRRASAWACVSGALEGIRVLDLSRLLPGGFCTGLLADFGADVLKVEDTGLGDYVRWAPPHYEGAEQSAGSRAVPRAQPQQALDPPRPQDRGGARGAAAARARVRRAARGLPPRRDGAPRRRLRAAARGEPRARLLRDHRLRAGRPVPRPLGPRHELPRPRRAARPDRRARRRRRCRRRARSPTSAAAR